MIRWNRKPRVNYVQCRADLQERNKLDDTVNPGRHGDRQARNPGLHACRAGGAEMGEMGERHG